MKKTIKAIEKRAHEEKGFLALAGEAFTVLGHEIVEGKDKLVEVTAEKIAAVKKAVKKIRKKKTVPAKKVAKKAVKKSPVKSNGKAAIKTVKKAAKRKISSGKR